MSERKEGASIGFFAWNHLFKPSALSISRPHCPVPSSPESRRFNIVPLSPRSLTRLQVSCPYLGATSSPASLEFPRKRASTSISISNITPAFRIPARGPLSLTDVAQGVLCYGQARLVLCGNTPPAISGRRPWPRREDARVAPPSLPLLYLLPPHRLLVPRKGICRLIHTHFLFMHLPASATTLVVPARFIPEPSSGQ